MGFDLYTSPDGQHFSAITRTGFGDMFNVGLRNLAATPAGLFIGSANHYYGLNIWRATQDVATAGIADRKLATAAPYAVYLPITLSSSGHPAPPELLQAENSGDRVILTWERPAGAALFHIFRADFTLATDLQIPDIDTDIWVPGPFNQIDTTDQTYFVDMTARAGQYYHYYVVADDGQAALSAPSNLARAPSLATAVTCTSVQATLADWALQSQTSRQAILGRLLPELATIRTLISSGDLAEAQRHVAQLEQLLSDEPALLESWRVEDLQVLLARLEQRLALAQLGIISPATLL